MNIEEQLKELDALINLYKDDPNDGLRNKIWVWYTNKLTKAQEEAVRGFVREFNNKCLHDSINESYSYPLEEIPNVVYSFVEEYLSSIGKDNGKGKIE